MKKTNLFIIIFLLFIAQLSNAQSLSGIYTIGGINPDYPTLTAATNDLISFGISGPVVFNVAAGTYNQQLNINGASISGISSINTITFQGDSTANTIITQVGTPVYVQANYVTIRNFTIQAIGLPSGISSRSGILIYAAQKCTIEDNIILMDSSYTTSNTQGIRVIRSTVNNACRLTTIKNNYIFGGNTGINVKGYQGYLIDSLIIDNNTIYKPYEYGIFCQYLQNPMITNNHISGRVLASSGVALTPSVGLQLDFVEAPYCAYNYAYVKSRAFIFSSINDAIPSLSTYKGEISNNIGIGSNANADGCLISSVVYLKLYNNSFKGNDSGISIGDGGHLDFRNNIFYGKTAHALWIDTYQGLNIFDTLDYNIYYAPPGHPLASIYYDDYSNLAALKSLSPSLNNHSLYGEPLFTSNTDLHLIGNLAHNKGDNSVGISIDFDGDMRLTATNPNIDIGADEFTPGSYLDIGITNITNNQSITPPNTPIDYMLNVTNFGTINITNFTLAWSLDGTLQTPIAVTNSITSTDTLFNYVFNNLSLSSGQHTIKAWTNMPNGSTDAIFLNDTMTTVFCVAFNGNYTVGTNNADFTSLTEVVNALSCAGIAGTTTFNIQPGTYQETLVIGDIAGTSPTSKLIFDGGNANLVVLQNPPIATKNITITLDGSQYVEFKNMKINCFNTTLSPSNFYTIRLINSAAHNRISDNLLSALPYSSNFSVIATDSSNCEQLVIENNVINGGGTGIYISGNTSTSLFKTIIHNNTITNFKEKGIYIEGQDSTLITNNTLSSTGDFVEYAMEVKSTESTIIANNNILTSGKGIRLNQVTGNNANSLIINNMIRNYDGHSIILDDVSNLKLYHNTTAGYGGIYVANIANIDILNNIFVSESAPAFEADLTLSNYANLNLDYNIYYSDFQYLAVDGSNYTDLASWTSTNGHNTQSIEEKPCFASDTDLHIFSSNGFNSGFSNNAIQNIVMIDIDGETRQGSLDIGADEFIPINDDLAIIDVLGLESGCDIADSFSVVLKNYGFSNQSNYSIKYWINNTIQGMASNSSISTINGFCNLDTITLYKNTFLNNTDTFDIAFIVSLPNDENIHNDTLLMMVYNQGIGDPVIVQDSCFGNVNILSATGPGRKVWYDDVSLTIPLDTTDTFTTPPLSSTDTFYVQALNETFETTGLAAPLSNGSFIINTFANGVIFEVNEPIILDSVDVYPDGTGTLQIHILDAVTNFVVFSSPIQNVTGNLTTKVPFYIGANLGIGNYKMSITYTGALTGLAREQGGFYTYPITTPSGSVSLTSAYIASTTINTNYYYWFYNWKIKTVGCPSNAVAVIVNPSSLGLNSSVADVFCTNNSLGAITLNPVNAIPPISYLWSDGTTNANLSNLGVGSYQVTVNDQNNCPITQTFQIKVRPDSLAVNPIIINIACHGDSSGSIDVNTLNALYPIIYTWDNGSSDSILTNIPQGIYTVTITDNANCSTTESITITEPLPLNMNVITVSDTANMNIGSATLVISGGITPYTINWSNGAFLPNIYNLAAGDYFVTITDGNNCVIDTMITINNVVSTNNFKELYDYKIYPNPSKDWLNFELNLIQPKNVSIQIINSIGQRVKQIDLGRVKAIQEQINLSEIPEGFYMIQVLIDNQSFVTERIIIQ